MKSPILVHFAKKISDEHNESVHFAKKISDEHNEPDKVQQLFLTALLAKKAILQYFLSPKVSKIFLNLETKKIRC